MEKTSKRLQAMIGLNPVRYCHIHGKHNCQDCIDYWVSEGIQADKELIAVQAKEIEKLKSSIKDYQDACAQKQEIIDGLMSHVA